MIKSKKGAVKIVGTVPVLLTDFACIVKSLLQSGIDAKMIDTTFAMAFMDHEELKEYSTDLEKFLKGKKDNG